MFYFWQGHSQQFLLCCRRGVFKRWSYHDDVNAKKYFKPEIAIPVVPCLNSRQTKGKVNERT